MVGPGRPPKRVAQYSDEQEEYEVEKIIKHRIDAASNVTYQVRWKNYGSDQDTWEPAENLENCPHVMKSYVRALNQRGDDIEEQKINAALILSRLPKKSKVEGFIFDGTDTVELQVSMDKKDHTHFVKEEMKKWQTDISAKCKAAGIENVFVTNTTDNVGPPPRFEYVTHCIMGKNVNRNSEERFVVGCDCPGGCGKSNSGRCCPQLMTGSETNEYNYTLSGRLRLMPGVPIYECNCKCNCDHNCPNRIVQKGRKIQLEIFRTSERGWGVRSMSRIKEGTFIAEYIGEVITIDVAEQRERITYLFDLDFYEGETLYTIDATNYGNVARFFNHSCEPNMVDHCVWIESPDPSMPQIAFFALHDIEKGVELTFDYKTHYKASGKTAVREKKDKIQCKCGSKNCKKFLRQ